MNWDRIEGSWEQVKGSARERWGKLTDDELQEAKGNRERLAGRVQERYGIAKDEAERQIDEWAARQNL
ncbi:MAG TPA: CsbD family protein [Thermohalobaculum sp.]|nr:CsbD family protein [Thermohalobaculum sp.]